MREYKEGLQTKTEEAVAPLEADLQDDGAGVKRPALRVTYIGSLIRAKHVPLQPQMF